MSELSTDQKLWLAEQLGEEVFIDDRWPSIVFYKHPTHELGATFDPENSPYWREKIVERLGEKHGIWITIDRFGWAFFHARSDNPWSSPLGSPTKDYWNYKQALFAACKWVWEQEKNSGS